MINLSTKRYECMACYMLLKVLYIVKIPVVAHMQYRSREGVELSTAHDWTKDGRYTTWDVHPCPAIDRPTHVPLLLILTHNLLLTLRVGRVSTFPKLHFL